MLKNSNLDPKNFTVQNKMFRKFFYENSAPIEDLVSFVEISNILLARKIGITNNN